MCSPATCKKCSKTTWSGCGAHVQQVMARVPKAQQCTCSASAEPASSPGRRWGLFRR